MQPHRDHGNMKTVYGNITHIIYHRRDCPHSTCHFVHTVTITVRVEGTGSKVVVKHISLLTLMSDDTGLSITGMILCVIDII